MQTGTAPATAVATDTFPINGTDYVEFYVGNAKQASHYYRTRLRISASRLPRARRPVPAIGPATCSSRTRSGSFSPHRIRPDHPIAGARALAWRRRPGHRALGRRRAGGLRRRGRAGRQVRRRSRRCCGTTTARW